MKIFKIVFPLLFFVTLHNLLSAQDKVVIDKVIAVVGNKIIKLSDIETQYLQMSNLNQVDEKQMKCQILEEMIFQKLMVTQAELDSVVVSDGQVDDELERRIRYFVDQIGSVEKLELFYKKNITEIKEEMRDLIKEMMLSRTMQNKITENVKVTPAEVRNFFQKIPEDSIPLIDEELEFGNIVKQPPISDGEIMRVKDKLNGMRDRIAKGDLFSTIAALYSDDLLTAKKGGELGFAERGHLKYPEFEAYAYSLKPNEVSPVIKSKQGYHIIQLIERRGEMINLRHILAKPKIDNADLFKAKIFLDSIANLINTGKINFEDAAQKFSDDPSKINGGIMVNPYSGNTRWQADQIEQNIYFAIEKLKPSQISQPQIIKNEDGTQTYRLFYLKNKIPSHKANLKDDYSIIQEYALMQKQEQALKDWIEKKKSNVYINIMDDYKNCNFKNKWTSF